MIKTHFKTQVERHQPYSKALPESGEINKNTYISKSFIT
jgi:hypothetical protein